MTLKESAATFNFRQFIRSIRFRLPLWFVAILAVIFGVFSLFIYLRQIQVLRTEAENRLITQGGQLSSYYRAVLHSLNLAK